MEDELAPLAGAADDRRRFERERLSKTHERPAKRGLQNEELEEGAHGCLEHDVWCEPGEMEQAQEAGSCSREEAREFGVKRLAVAPPAVGCV